MSSETVRNEILAFIASELPTEKVVDISGDYEEIGDLLEDAGVGLRQPWLAIQFVGNGESPITVPATNTSGKYRETGLILLHIVEPSRLGVVNGIVARATPIANKFRGQRINGIQILDMVPLNTSVGSTLAFQKGFSSGTIVLNYRNDLDL